MHSSSYLSRGSIHTQALPSPTHTPTLNLFLVYLPFSFLPSSRSPVRRSPLKMLTSKRDAIQSLENK